MGGGGAVVSMCFTKCAVMHMTLALNKFIKDTS